MQIDIDLLFSWGAVAKKYKKNEVVFNESEEAHFYYQIINGSVRMYNSNDEGKEFTQGLFSKGESFGEPPLFIDQLYPSKAVCLHDATIIKLCKEKFLKILDEYPIILKSFLILLIRLVITDQSFFPVTGHGPKRHVEQPGYVIVVQKLVTVQELLHTSHPVQFLLYAVKTFHYGHYHFLEHFIIYIHHGMYLLSF